MGQEMPSLTVELRPPNVAAVNFQPSDNALLIRRTTS